MDEPSFYAVIPATIRYDKSLPPNAKLLYGEITALCNKNGYCWAENSYFAALYDVETETISRWVSKLKTQGYIRTELIYKDNSKEIAQRRIYLAEAVFTPIDKKINTSPQKDQDPIDLKVKDNNTLNITKEERDACASVTYTRNGTRSIPVNQSANDLLETYVAPLRDFFGGVLADEYRWGSVCTRAIAAQLEPPAMVGALSALMAQNRTYTITPENVLQYALQERAKRSHVKPAYNALTPEEQEQRRQIAIMQENYYAGR